MSEKRLYIRPMITISVRKGCAKLRCFFVDCLVVEIIPKGLRLFSVSSEAVGIETCLPQCVSIRRSIVKCLHHVEYFFSRLHHPCQDPY